jgi:hypothetical protein
MVLGPCAFLFETEESMGNLILRNLMGTQTIYSHEFPVEMIKIQIYLPVHDRLRSREKRFDREIFPLPDDVFLMVLSSYHRELFAKYSRFFT